MPLPPFVLIEHPTELKDKTLVLQTSPPYCIGEVLRFDTDEKAEAFERNNATRVWHRSPSHRIYLLSSGSMDNGRPIVADIQVALKCAYEEYHKMRIIPNAPRFNRYVR